MPALRPLTASVCCDLTANLADLGDLGGSAPDVVRTSFYITDTVSGIRCHRIISHSWAAKPVSEGLPIFMLFLIQCFSSHVITLHIISNTLFIFSTYLFPRRSCRTSPISLQGSLNLHLLDLLHRGRLSVTVQNRKLTCFLSLQKKKPDRRTAATLVQHEALLTPNATSFQNKYNICQINIWCRTRGKTTGVSPHIQKR